VTRTAVAGDRSRATCGPLAVPRAENSREQARTAFRDPSVCAVLSLPLADLQGSEPATFHRGVRFKLAFLSRFRPLCGPDSGCMPSSTPIGREACARTVRERDRRQSTMVLACPPCSRQRQTGRWTTAHGANQMGSSDSSALRLRRLCDGAALPRYVVMLWLSVDVDLRVLPGNADRATPSPRRTHRHFNPRDSAHRDQPLGDK
jgi:hypothetical protein